MDDTQYMDQYAGQDFTEPVLFQEEFSSETDFIEEYDHDFYSGLDSLDISNWTWGYPAAAVEYFTGGEGVIGEPLEDMSHWHQQMYPDSCAIASQEFILDSITGYDFSEEQLLNEAYTRGWYHPGGTPALYVGNLLELHGVPVEREFNATLQHLNTELEKGNKVLVGVDGDELLTQGIVPMRDDWAGDWRSIPGQDANHVVQVIGVNTTDRLNPMVILNDPGHPGGCGMMVPVEKFANAWADSGNFLVHTIKPESTSSMIVHPLTVPYQPMFAGYYNADGTYHYTSDNTDRDPETGAIVRRW